MRRSSAVVVALVVIVSLTTSVGFATAEPDPQRVGAATSRSQQGLATSLAKEVRRGEDLHAAVVAVRRALAQGGVATVAGGRVITKAKGPASNRIWAADTVIMARELWRQPQFAGDRTWHDAAVMLAKAEVLPKNKPRRVSIDKLVVLLVNQWVREAGKKPARIDAFVPLFLAALAKNGPQHLNLAKPFKPSAVRLSGLEWWLFWSAVSRGAHPGGRGRSAQEQAAAGSRAASGPCSDALKELGDVVPVRVGAGEDAKPESFKDLLKSVLGEVIKKVVKGEDGKDLARSVSITLKLAQILQRMHATMLLIKTASVAILPAGNPGSGVVQRPFRDPVDYVFTGQGGVSEEAERELRDSDVRQLHGVRDCVRALGIPWFDDIADLQDDIKNWRIQWKALGNPFWAEINASASQFDDLANQIHKLRYDPATDPFHGYADLHVNINPYQDRRDPDVLSEFVKEWKVRADLLTNKPPDVAEFKSMVKAVMGGKEIEFGVSVAAAIADILENWALVAFAPRTINFVDIVEPLPCDRLRQRLVRLQVLRQVSGPACEDAIYLKVEGGSMLGTWTAQGPANTCGGSLAGTGEESMTAGAAPFDAALGRLAPGGTALLVASGPAQGSDTLNACRFDPATSTVVPCTETTSHDGRTGSVSLRLSRENDTDVRAEWSTGPISFGNVGSNDCDPPSFTGFPDDAVTTIPFAQLSEPGLLQFGASRQDNLTVGPPVAPITILGSASMSISVRRVNADGTPYTG